MINPVFRKHLVFSLLGHLTVFGLFAISFGERPADSGNFNLNFRGVCFTNYEMAVISKKQIFQFLQPALKSLFNKTDLTVLQNNSNDYSLSPRFYSKPRVNFAYNQVKEFFTPKTSDFFLPSLKPAIMFYPHLPDYFNLYFKDRQVAHIELFFNIKPDNSSSPIEIKRKISSGNLEADLLSIRYISRYLFIQKLAFNPNSWQSVKIELSAKND